MADASRSRSRRLSRRDVLRGGAAGTAALALGSTLGTGRAQAATRVPIDPGTRYQTFEGWGTALSWGANAIGGWRDVDARAEIVDLLYDDRRGLGLEIARYNIGAAEHPDHDHMRLSAEIPSLMPRPGEWDLTRDAAQRWVLERAVRGSARHVEGFVTSPHHWWTHSGCASGAVDKGNNLKPEHVGDFADFVTEIPRVFAREWGIRIDALSPVNEPSADWWVANGSQEGCHYDPEYQRQVLVAVHERLRAKGLDERVGISMSEEPGAEAALTTLGVLGDEARRLRTVTTHSYWDQERTGLRDAVRALGASLWMSEWGTSGDAGYEPQHISNALNLSRTMLRDLRELQADAWNVWNAIESQEANRSEDVSWGLIHATYTPGQEDFYVAKQYYGYGNYAKFVRQGSVAVEIGDPQAFATYDAKRRRLVVVFTERGTADRDVTLDLGRFAPRAGAVLRHRTSATENLATLRPEIHRDGTYRTTLKGESITTFEFPGVFPRR